MLNSYKNPFQYGLIASIIFILASCITPKGLQKVEVKLPPASYIGWHDSLSFAEINWREIFTDPNLKALIDSALKNNQELNILLQEIKIANNEVRTRKGEYLPIVEFGAAAGVDKVGRYTRFGALESNNEIKTGEEFPEPLTDFMFGAYASWELDVWKKLRNAKKAAVMEYLASIEGKNFMITNLISEISSAYYELLALDNQYEILEQYINIQNQALEVVRMQKAAAKVTELAVKKFEAEVLKNKSLLFEVRQKRVEAENKINILVGRYPQKVIRNSGNFININPIALLNGVPSQLLMNRPDIRQAEMELAAAKLNVKVARANFYPSLRITADIGYQAFKTEYLIASPASMLYNLAGDLVAPLISRNAIKAEYYNANAKQVQKVLTYEQTIITAYTEVLNLLNNIENVNNSYNLKSKEVEALTKSIAIANKLFQSARADYMEVLLTQRDALEAKIDLVEAKTEQLITSVKMYQALGGGWR